MQTISFNVQRQVTEICPWLLLGVARRGVAAKYNAPALAREFAAKVSPDLSRLPRKALFLLIHAWHGSECMSVSQSHMLRDVQKAMQNYGLLPDIFDAEVFFPLAKLSLLSGKCQHSSAVGEALPHSARDLDSILTSGAVHAVYTFSLWPCVFFSQCSGFLLHPANCR